MRWRDVGVKCERERDAVMKYKMNEQRFQDGRRTAGIPNDDDKAKTKKSVQRVIKKAESSKNDNNSSMILPRPCCRDAAGARSWGRSQSRAKLQAKSKKLGISKFCVTQDTAKLGR